MRFRRIVLALALPLLLAQHACLITSDKQYQDDKCPVALASYLEPQPQGVTHVDSDTATAQFSGTAWVSSCSLAQDLQAIVKIDQIVKRAFPVSATGDTPRQVDVIVPLADQPDGCHRIDLEVSHSFDFGQPHDGPNDLAVVTWWIDLSPKGSSTPITDCQGAQ